MRIYKFSNILAIPFGLSLMAFLFLLFQDSKSMVLAWAVIPIAALILIYLFQPQLDYWYLSRKPVQLDDEIHKLLRRTNSYYKQMSDDAKMEFDKRISLYVQGRAFNAKGMEKDTDVPHDIKHLIAQVPVSMTMTQNDFLIKDYERIILYKHAFPSPAHRYLHTMELHHEDGVIILSLEHAEAGFFYPSDFYNIVWHAFAEVLLRKEMITLDALKEDEWKSVKEISGFEKKFIYDTIGMPEIDSRAVVVSLYFTNPVRFQEVWPEKYQQLNYQFSLN